MSPGVVLVADDEPDVLSVTKLALKSVRPPLTFHEARSGAETVQLVREHPEIGVLLLDVVMETDDAGLRACAEIRSFNPLIRILLRTGQPGQAPERATIDNYDIDGYLPKAELNSRRLYTAVRTAMRAFDRLVELDRHGRALQRVHDAVVALHPWDPLPDVLDRVLGAAASLCSAPLAVLELETFGAGGDPERFRLHVCTGEDSVRAAVEADAAAASVRNDRAAAAGAGTLVPLSLERELGEGFVYLPGIVADEFERRLLPVLMGHAANAIHAVLARRLAEDDRPVFDAMRI